MMKFARAEKAPRFGPSSLFQKPAPDEGPVEQSSPLEPKSTQP